MAKKRKKENYRDRADVAFSKFIRSRGVCESDREEHQGRFQCAHIISRRYGATRVDEENALCLCAGCHWYFTHAPLEWEDFIKAKWPGRWERIRAKALTGERPDWKAEAAYWEGQDPTRWV